MPLIESDTRAKLIDPALHTRSGTMVGRFDHPLEAVDKRLFPLDPYYISIA